MTTSHRKENSPRNIRSLFIPLVIITVIIGSLFLIYREIHSSKKAITAEEQLDWQIPTPPTTPPDLNEVSTNLDGPKNSIPRPANVTPAVLNDRQPNPCANIGKELNLFFSQLSEQEYIKAYDIGPEFKEHINRIIIKLLNNPPIITSESTDNYTILKNGSHFYRILGPKDISLIKDILTYESESTEDLLASLYSWATLSPTCQDKTLPFNFSLEKSYEYSAFFLKTLGGQSYLARRESRLMSLVKYYSLLIIDLAEQQNVNTYKINIDTYLPSIMNDFEQTKYLMYKENYLKKLINLSLKHPN